MEGEKLCMESSLLGFGSRVSAFGPSSVNPGGAVQQQLALPVRNEVEQSVAKLQSNLGLNIQPIGPVAHLTRTQREEVPSTSRVLIFSRTSPAPEGYGHSIVESRSNSLDLLSVSKKLPVDDSSTHLPDSLDCDTRVTSQNGSPESRFPKDTQQLADKIMRDFGLEKDDLNALLSYPDDQTTVENLPSILDDIRKQKAKRAVTAVKSVPQFESQLTKSMSAVDTIGTFGMAGTHQDDKPLSNKVIEYGNTGKYTAEAKKEVGKTVSKRGQSMLLMDTFSDENSSRDPQGIDIELKRSSMDSSCDPLTSVTTLRKIIYVQSDQTYEQIPLSQPKHNTDTIFTKVSKSVSNIQPSSSSFHGVNPSLLPRSSTDLGCNIGHRKTEGQESLVGEQMRKEQVENIQQQQSQQYQMQTQSVLQMWQALFPAASPSVPSAAFNSTVTDASHPLLNSVLIPSDPYQSMNVPSQPVPNPTNITRTACFELQSRGKKVPSKAVASSDGLPTLAMMHDYAATIPRVFSHTCSLCKTECTDKKDWISHQKTSLHLENCKLLREQYPQWDGKVPLLHSPLHHQSSASRREPHVYQERSPHSPRRTHRSWSRSRSRSPRHDHPTSSRRRSRSRSHERRSSPRKRGRKRLAYHSLSPPPRRSHERHSSPRRSDERSWSPKRRFSPRRQRRSSSPKRSDEKRLTPRGSLERPSSPTLSHSKGPSPRRGRKRQASTGKAVSKKKKACSLELLTKKVLETSAIQSLSEQPSIEEMVKTMVPFVLAELAKMTSTSSPSKDTQGSSSSPGPGKSSASSDASSSSPSTSMKAKPHRQKSKTSSHPQPKLCKTSPPTMLKLRGISDTLCRSDVVSAMEDYGKTKSVVFLKSKREAAVCFERGEDAEKLRSLKTLKVKGVSLAIVTEKGHVPERAPLSSAAEQEKPPQPKAAVSFGTTAQTKEAGSGGGLTVLPLKKLLSIKSNSRNTSAGKRLTNTKVLVSKAKSVSKKAKCRSLKIGNTLTKGVKLPLVKKKTTTKPKSEVNTKKSAMAPIVNTEVKNLPDMTFSEPAEGTEVVAEAEVAGSKAETATTEQKPKAEEAVRGETHEKPAQRLASREGGAIESSESYPPSSKGTETSKSTASENQPVTSESLKAKHCEPEARDTKGTSKVDITGKSAASEAEQQPELDVKTTEVKGPALSEFGKTQALESSAVGEGGEQEEAKPSENCPPARPAETTPHIPAADPPLTQQTTTPKTWDRTSLQVPESRAPDKKTAASQPLAAGAALKAKGTAGGAVTTLNQTGSATAAKTQKNPALKSTGSVSAAPACAPTSQSRRALPAALTAGETMQWYLKPQRINCVLPNSVLASRPFTRDSTLLLITNLPKFEHGAYTEADLVNLLCNFGFEYAHDNIFVIPQTSMAFALMPNVRTVKDIIRASLQRQIHFINQTICLNVVKSEISMTPMGFYKSLMNLTPFRTEDDGTSTVYIQNISPDEVRNLKDTLRKIGSVRNYLPLLNKVFVEFETVYDADRLGIWYSLLRRGHHHKVDRLKLPRCSKRAKPPKLPTNAVPDKKDLIPGAEIYTTKFGIPQGTTPPFWITMTTSPYLFPTVSPWFDFPDFMTIQKMDYIKQVHHPGSKFSTIMMTGLPEGDYTHKDIAKLVWRYFPKQTLNSLNYNLLVLPLQRRAFVYFCDRDACCSFVQDHIKSPVSVRGLKLSIHFILEDMHPGSSEEVMYRNLMKWSNTNVLAVESLEERLLCVEISETNVDLIKMVANEVASIASFVNFLPLANRICIEMFESSGVTKVVMEIVSRKDLTTHKLWSKVKRVESLRTLKQRLQDSGEITIDLEVEAPPTKPSDYGAQPASAESTASVEPSISKPEVASEDGGAGAHVTENAAEAINVSMLPTSEPAVPQGNGTASQIKQQVGLVEGDLSKDFKDGEPQGLKRMEPMETEPSAKRTGKKLMNLEGNTTAVINKPLTVKSGTRLLPSKTSDKAQPALQTSSPASAQPAASAGPKPSKSITPALRGTSDASGKKTAETVGTPSTAPQTSEDKEKTETRGKGAEEPGAVSAPKAVQTGGERSAEVGAGTKQKAEGTATKTASVMHKGQDEAAEEANKTIGKKLIKPQQKDAVAAIRTPATPAPKAASSASAAGPSLQPALTASPSADESALTVGERIGSLLDANKLYYLSMKMILSPKNFSTHRRLILITNLPKYTDGCYTEADIANLLHQFGFHYLDKNIFVIPQACMAFVLMPNFESVQQAFKASKNNHITLNGFPLVLRVVCSKILMSPRVIDDGVSIIYINNITWNETRELRTVLKKIDSVRNYLPLLNKVFIEFESIRDADRLGVWYSLLKHCPANNVYRMRLPHSVIAPPPRLAAKALPDSSNIVSGVVAPTTTFGVPQGSAAPFAVTLRMHPFVFPTLSPWFIIPNFLTVRNKMDIWKAGTWASKAFTIMLTGLPGRNYTHQDVAKLVWRYFPEQNLHTLYYSVLVLPLQKRAFVYFNSYKSCYSFIEDQSRAPLSVKDYVLSTHLVLEQMDAALSEEIMYRSMMKWSNSHVPELESLAERLLCVEIFETSIPIITMVMKAVVSIAPFVSFLPLSNRICIEMAESSGVSEVVEKIAHVSAPKEWSKVGHVESVKSLKQRLQDSNEITINLEGNTTAVSNKPLTVKSGAQLLPSKTSDKAQPALQTSSPASAQPAASAGPKPSKSITPALRGTSNTSGKKNTETVGTPSTAPQASEDKEKTETRGKGAEEPGAVSAPKAVQTGGERSVKVGGTATKTASIMQKGQDEAAGILNAKNVNEPSVNLKDADNISTSSQMKQQAGPAKVLQSTTTSAAKTTANQPPPASATPPQRPQSTTKTQEPSAKAPPPVHQTAKQKAGSTAQEQSNKTPQSPQQPAEAALKAKEPQLSTNGGQKALGGDGKVSAVATGQTASCKAAAAAAASNKKPPAAAASTPLTPGERIKSLLSPKQFSLPEHNSGFYTEAEFVRCLGKYKVHCDGDTNMIIPELRMFDFYRRLMRLVKYGTNDDGTRTVYIQNITPSETSDLRKALCKMGTVKNFLPLLNKVFVEFKSCIDADRLGVWYSLLKRQLSHKVYRMKAPKSLLPTQPPREPAWAMPDSSDVVAGATPPTAKCGVPDGSCPPFWITMTASPYIFPTASPWFNIPGSEFFTIMLTGLPDETYTHEDVAKLVWPFFPEQNLHALYYRVMVLPLQRRAFVYFSQWDMCCRFIQNHLQSPVSVNGSILNIHLVLENMDPGASEHVSNLESLKERLLCVEVSGVDVVLIMAVMKEVASMASFVRFLPLSNRIYIEMAESSGVTKVVGSISAPKLSEQCEAWYVRTFCQSRKQRLQDCEQIAVNLKQGTIGVQAKPSKTKSKPSQPHPAPQSSAPAPPPPAARAGAAVSKAATSKLRSTASTVSEETPTCPPLTAAGGLKPAEDVTELPQIDQDSFNAIKAAVHQYRLTREGASPSKVQEVIVVIDHMIPNQSTTGCSGSSQHEDASPRKTLDSQAAVAPSDNFDEENLNLGDFVTLDEISEDTQSTAADGSYPSHAQPSCEKDEVASSAVSSAAKDSKGLLLNADSSKNEDTTQVEEIERQMEDGEDSVVKVFMVVDSAEEESIQETSATERSSRRRTARELKGTPPDMATAVITKPTRTAQKESGREEKEETPKRGRNTAAREFPSQKGAAPTGSTDTNGESGINEDKASLETVDIVEEGETQQKEEEGTTPRRRGRPRKRSREQTPVRRSIRGKKAAGSDLEAPHVEEEEEENKGLNKKKIKLGPETKHCSSQSPEAAAVFTPPAFNPKTPCVPYLNDGPTEDAHCKSQKHYDNLQ
ncbi:unnamed protein product, partial [Menidia menidia]